MKKIILMISCAVLLASCQQTSNKGVESSVKEDSLQNIIDQKDQSFNELIGLLDEVQEGFAQINEAQGRVNTLDKNLEGSNAKANIQDNMLFIEQTLEEQRQKIENLQKKVDDGIITSGKLKSMIENLQNQLTEKSKDIEGLRAQLADKDIQIENLGKSVTQLQTENEQVKEESENRAQIVRNQDTQLNTAYFVYGTNKELKEHKILQSGDVLANNDFDRDYFTKIDIRKTTVIPFGSKSAKLLTTHPEGSYTLLKDSKGEYTLRITDPNKFWSVSKYLVVRVK